MRAHWREEFIPLSQGRTTPLTQREGSDRNRVLLARYLNFDKVKYMKYEILIQLILKKARVALNELIGSGSLTRVKIIYDHSRDKGYNTQIFLVTFIYRSL